MSNQQHTPGPWVVTDDFIRGTDSGNFPNGYEYVAKVSTEYLDSPIDRKNANARRIVACVNSCEGINTDYLEHFGATTFNDFKRVKDQRDELLAALEAMFGKYGSKNPALDDEVTAQARAAIAKVKGGAA